MPSSLLEDCVEWCGAANEVTEPGMTAFVHKDDVYRPYMGSVEIELQLEPGYVTVRLWF